MTWVKRVNGEIVDLDNIGIRTVDFIVNSPSYEHTTEKPIGSDGEIDLGTTLGPRGITVHFKMNDGSYIGFGLKRDVIFALFKSREAFYLIEKRNPGKQWLVKVASPYVIEQRFSHGLFSIDFIAYSGCSESVGTSLNPRTFDEGVWQVSQGLMTTDYRYAHSTNEFEVYNAGGITVDPRKMYLKILFQGQSNNIEIINETTGEMWNYIRQTTANDNLLIDGIRSTKNQLSIFRETNRKLISLAPGMNRFKLNGTSGIFLITFDFKFYYL